MLIADTHVHLYPVYDSAAFLEQACANLHRLTDVGGGDHLGLFLTERRDCRFFEGLVSGKALPPNCSMTHASESDAVFLTGEASSCGMILFAGSQIVTREGLEVLSLAAASRVDEGLSAAETLTAVRETGGVPVLSWAPGKWTGPRGRVVRDLVESHGSEPLLLGDTAMRPRGFPEPGLFRLGREAGIPIVAGTDPLPIPGDGAIAGTYGIRSVAFDPESPVSSARALLTEGNFTCCGERASLLANAGRWLRNFRASRS